MESILTTFIGSDFQTVNSLLLEICRRMVHRRLWHLKTFVADHVTVQSCDITCHQLLDGMMWFLYYCCLGAFTSHFYPCGTVLAGTSYGFLSVCVCLSQVSVLSKGTDRSSWFLVRTLLSTYITVIIKLCLQHDSFVHFCQLQLILVLEDGGVAHSVCYQVFFDININDVPCY